MIYLLLSSLYLSKQFCKSGDLLYNEKVRPDFGLIATVNGTIPEL
ncbi:hypothetical protein [Oceanobacillus sp. CAU 1775]